MGGPRIIGPEDGKAVNLASIGVRFMAWTEETGGGFSLVEHPMPPKTLAAPLHRHSREDEYSYVLEGRMGALLGDDVFEHYFDELASLLASDFEPQQLLEVGARYGFEADPKSIPRLCAEHGLTHPALQG